MQTDVSPTTQRWRWILLIVVLISVAAALAALLIWMVDVRASVRDRPFRGKPESEWIKTLKYNDDDQVKEWRAYGKPGVEVWNVRTTRAKDSIARFIAGPPCF